MLAFRTFLFLSIIFFFSACSSDFENLAKSDFSSHELKPWGKPFTALWTDPQVKDKKIATQKIFIKPLNTHYLPKSDSEFENNAIQRLSLYFDQNLAEKIKQNSTAAYRTTNDIKNARFLLEPALVQVEPTLYGLNFLSFGTSLFVPLVSYAFNPFTHGEMTLMAKISDSKTGRVYAVFADHRPDEATIFGSIRDFTPYGHHFRTMDMWTDKMADILGSEPGQEIKNPRWITLNPF